MSQGKKRARDVAVPSRRAPRAMVERVGRTGENLLAGCDVEKFEYDLSGERERFVG